MDTTEMISKDNNIGSSSRPQEEEYDKVSLEDHEFQELVQTLPKEKTWYGSHLYFYQGFWCPSFGLKPVLSFQKHFQALDTDIIVTSVPKCGTTWLKALTFSIVNRHKFAREENPLLSFNPHQLVPFVQDLYSKTPLSDLENTPLYQQRILSTHIPYASLPPSIKDSNSKIIYICRNPMDAFISLWFFTYKMRDENVELLSLNEAFNMFCQGIHICGPFFDHVLGYWKASQENPNKILFLRYEDLKEDIVSHIKRLAMFLGFPFSEEEDKDGVVEEIAKTCSFENLKELDVNKNGRNLTGVPHKSLFRKAEVGDWSNYLKPSMAERLEKLIQEKLDNSGLTFKISCKTTN